MERFTQQDLQAFSTCLLTLYTPQPLSTFAAQVLRALSIVIPAESFFYVEMDLQTPFASSAVVEPASLAFSADDRDVVATIIREHPIVQNWRQTGNGQALMLSDFLTGRKYHRLSLYHAYYQPRSIEQQLAIGLLSAPLHMTAVVLNRQRHAFSERSRSRLNLLRPHIWHASQNAQAFTRLQEMSCHQEPELARRNRAVLVQHAAGRSWELTEPAWDLVKAYFDTSPRHPQRLPDIVQRWIRQQQEAKKRDEAMLQPCLPLCRLQARARLLIRYLEDERGEPSLLLEEQPTRAAAAVLQALGLTPRQAEVLFWIAQGKTNQDVALILKTQPGTIKKHLEHIYHRLGVENRTAATRHALEQLGILHQPS